MLDYSLLVFNKSKEIPKKGYPHAIKILASINPEELGKLMPCLETIAKYLRWCCCEVKDDPDLFDKVQAVVDSKPNQPV